MTHVLIFIEGFFDHIATRTNPAEALSYSIGFLDGAHQYGGCSCGAYVMPVEEEDMRENEKADEVEKAMAAMAAAPSNEAGPRRGGRNV